MKDKTHWVNIMQTTLSRVCILNIRTLSSLLRLLLILSTDPSNTPLGQRIEEGFNSPQHPTSPEQLYNPFNNDAEPSYTRIETAEGTLYQHATAGQILEVGDGKTRRQKWREENQAKHDGNSWGLWGTKTEWDDAYWMATTKASQSSLEELLKTECVSDIYAVG
jgi:hypothetical protein